MLLHGLRRAAAAAVAAVTFVVAGCGNTDQWVLAHPADGWPAQYGNAANSSFTALPGAATLKQDWARSVKGSLGSQVILGSTSYLAVNAQSPAGCSLMVWQSDEHGRQRWCTRLWQGGAMSSPLFDGFDNLYVGQPGAILAYPPTQWIRWRKPVIGMPTTPRILSPGQLLVVTHLGQVLVFDAHRGDVVGTPLDLVGGIDPTDSERGLADCPPARPACPISAAPAYSSATNIVVISLWQPGAEAPTLLGLRYRPGQTPLLSREWTSTAVGGEHGAGPIASPVLSADGKTIYVNGRDQHLWALNSADGKAKWSVDLGFQPQTPPSVSPEGLIVAGGGPHTKLTAVKDKGDHGEQAWSRQDVEPLTTSTRAGTDIGYAVVRDGDQGQALLVFAPGDGHTVGSYPLPGATGWPVGVSVGHDKRVVTATSDGQVFAFAPA